MSVSFIQFYTCSFLCIKDSRQNAQRHPVGEMLLSEASGMFVYNPESPVVADGSDDEEAEADGLRKVKKYLR